MVKIQGSGRRANPKPDTKGRVNLASGRSTPDTKSVKTQQKKPM